ncbi:type I glyceraldehyde-3-phosphate dehydrogenase [Niveibacterium sp. SC-1]|uniref:type I glyceraldehyde-3-phosphate dehydrogenase n=1 Tax=Niveibacterium sp. SC-1 TaxID=3135646 RepID=UPI00311EC02C
MSARVAINGFGRIGRNALRAYFESAGAHDYEIVAINDLGSPAINAHLLRHDTVHGRFREEVRVEGDDLVVGGKRIRVLAERDPAKLPWKDLNIDIVLECTGRFTSREKAAPHIAAGARKVIISAPAGKEVDATIVRGVNDQRLKASDQIIGIGSCTTNCLATMIKPLHDALGVETGLMTTIHSFTNDQVLTDVYHEDPRRARSAVASMIPTKTGAASAIGLVLPELEGRLDGFSIRVPTLDVCMLDLSLVTKRATSVADVNALMRAASEAGPLKGIVKYTEEPLVSSDYIHDDASSIFDATLTKVLNGTHVKVYGWYDNEWGFSNRLLDVAGLMLR